MATKKITPLGDRVLIEPMAVDEKTKSGIIIPESAAEKQNIGTVVAIGTLEEIKDVKIGDTVLFGYSYEVAKADGKEYYVIQSKDLIAVIK